MIITQEKYLLNKFYKTTTLQTLFIFAIYLYISFLSPFLSELGWTEGSKGWFFSIFSIAGIFLAPFIGSLADSLGRFRLIIGGFFLEIACIIGYMYIDNIAGLMFIRMLASVSFSAVIIGGLSRINDIVTDKNRSTVTGLFESFKSIGVLIAPLIGGIIVDLFGFIALFQFSLGVLVLILFCLFIFDKFFYDDHYPHRTRAKFKPSDINPIQAIPAMLKYKEIKMISIIGSIVNITAPFSITVLPYIIIDKMQLSFTHLSIAVMVIGFAHIFQFGFGKFADYIGKEKAIALGIGVASISLIGMFFTTSYMMLLITTLICSFGRSLFNTSTLAYMSDIGERFNVEGKVLGTYTAVGKIAMAISFTITGYLLVELGSGIFLIYAGVGLIATYFAIKLPSSTLIDKENT